MTPRRRLAVAVVKDGRPVLPAGFGLGPAGGPAPEAPVGGRR